MQDEKKHNKKIIEGEWILTEITEEFNPAEDFMFQDFYFIYDIY